MKSLINANQVAIMTLGEEIQQIKKEITLLKAFKEDRK